RIAGSDDESGTGIFKALAAGAARIDLTLSSGQRSEVENLTAATPSGSWSGPDGVAHPMAFHNLLTEPAWFFPAFALSSLVSAPNAVISYIGPETHDGQSVLHITASRQFPSMRAKTASLTQH